MCIRDRNGSLYLPGNDPFIMYPGKAYLVKVTSDVILTIDEGEERLSSPFIAQSKRDHTLRDRPDHHFEPVWEGTPFTPMAFVLDEAQWNYLDLEPGDEVGIFDGNLCVGAYTVPEEGFSPGAQIPTSKDDGSGNGFTEGHTVKFRVWKGDLETDIDADIFSFTDVITGNAVPQVFVALSGVNVEMGVQPPSSPYSFNANGSSTQVNINWSTPSQGNYNVYEDGVPSQAIFYRLSRDGSLLIEGYQSNSFTDNNLSNNTLYDYELQALSLIHI